MGSEVFFEDRHFASIHNFNEMASTYLTRTPSGAGTNSKIFTLSLWIKRCGLGASQAMMGTGTSSGHSSVFLENYFAEI